MWPDNETDRDFLNFTGVAETVAVRADRCQQRVVASEGGRAVRDAEVHELGPGCGEGGHDGDESSCHALTNSLLSTDPQHNRTVDTD